MVAIFFVFTGQVSSPACSATHRAEPRRDRSRSRAGIAKKHQRRIAGAPDTGRRGERKKEDEGDKTKSTETTTPGRRAKETKSDEGEKTTKRQNDKTRKRTTTTRPAGGEKSARSESRRKTIASTPTSGVVRPRAQELKVVVESEWCITFPAKPPTTSASRCLMRPRSSRRRGGRPEAGP